MESIQPWFTNLPQPQSPKQVGLCYFCAGVVFCVVVFFGGVVIVFCVTAAFFDVKRLVK